MRNTTWAYDELLIQFVPVRKFEQVQLGLTQSSTNIAVFSFELGVIYDFTNWGSLIYSEVTMECGAQNLFCVLYITLDVHFAISVDRQRFGDTRPSL